MLSTPASAHLSKENADYWLNVYGTLTEEDYPLAGRVQSIFSNVLQAADKRGDRFPKLLIIKGDCDPWSLALKDGTIVISEKAINICYHDTSLKNGDARIAFFIGHELAHLAKDDFWHADIFRVVKQFGKTPRAVEQILDLLKKTTNIDKNEYVREMIKTKELQADSYGILYASLAGYNPNLLFTEQEHLFFKQWVNQISKQAIFDSKHCDSKQRETILKANIESVINQIPFFDFGVRLFQLGKYKDALDFLLEFRKVFPCREVFNNIGLIYYQLAIDSLASIKPEKVYQFKLSTILDTETRAKKYSVKRSPQKDFQMNIKHALRYFKSACEKDLLYIPSRINLSSVYIMMQKYSKAMAELDDVLQIEPGHIYALNNRAVAMFLLGPSIQIDMFKQSGDVFKKLIKKNPEYSAPYYNLARIHTDDRKRNAVDIWSKFLRIEKQGAYANEAQKMIKQFSGKSQIPGTSIVSLKKHFNKSPIPLGKLNDKTIEELQKYPKYILEMGGIEGEYIQNEKYTVLIIENVVSIVETYQHIKIKSINDFGDPLRIFQDNSCKKTYVFDDVAIDIINNKFSSVIYYQKVENRY